jgi:lambda repressor-like predicted transcriptional regulator
MKHKAYVLAGIVAVLALAWMVAGPAVSADDEAPRITKEELKARLGDPAVTMIDVRYKQNWKKSGQKIAKAVREDPNEISSWAGKYKKDQMLVFYCD